MKLLTRYILKEHFIPFVYALLILIFLLFTNFFLKAIDRLLGKGLPLSIMLEYLFLNMGWVLSLAIPMAVLIATLMAFGRLSEDNEVTALRSSGVSFPKILLPALIFSFVIAGPLIYFNNFILPEMNHKTRKLYRDIYRKRPDLSIEPGYFIDDLPKYSLIVKDKKDGKYQDVRIYSKEQTKTQTSINAKEGTFSTLKDAILLTLFDGEIHELDTQNLQNYRRIIFEKHQIVIPAEDLMLKSGSSPSRGDRDMTVTMINDKIESYRQKQGEILKRIRKKIEKEFKLNEVPKDYESAKDLIDHQNQLLTQDTTLTSKQVKNKKRTLKILSQRLSSDYQQFVGYQKNINRIRVEKHKKFSIPVACIVFILIGAPLGIMAKKGSLVTSISFSFGFFLIYWIFLIGGEELADRNLLSPVIAMWTPNVLLGTVGIIMSVITTREQKNLSLPFRRKDKDDAAKQ